MAREMSVPFLGKVPLDPGIVSASDEGKPYVTNFPHSDTGKIFASIAVPIFSLGGVGAGGRNGDGEAAGTGVSSVGANVRIAIPIAAGNLSPRFATCEEIGIFEVDRQTRQILHKSLRRAPAHLPDILPRRLKELRANVVLATEMGERAQQLLAQQGVKVVLGVSSKPAEQVVSDYLNEEAAAKAAGTHGE